MADRIVKLLKELTGGKEFVHLDLSEAKAKELIFELYGPEEFMREHYPLTYRAFREAAALPGGRDSSQKLIQDYAQEETYVFGDGVALDVYGMQADQSFWSRGISAFGTTKQVIDQAIVASDEYDNEVDRVQNTASYVTSLTTELKSDKLKEGKAYTIFCCFTEIPANGPMQTQICTSPGFVVGNRTCVADQTVLTFPRHGDGTGEDDTVCICYGRTPSDGEACDRTYDSQLVDGSQRLYLDVDGEITLLEGYEFSSIDPSNFKMRITAGNGMAEYQNKAALADPGAYFSRSGERTVAFAFPEDWNDLVPTERTSMDDQAELIVQFTMAAETVNPVTGEHTVVEDIFSFSHDMSRDMPNRDNCYTPKMILLWGCVAADTQVLMADGSRKAIRDLLIGDRIRTGRDSARVSQVWKGREKGNSVGIAVRNGGRLVCTSTHPVLTGRGMIPAGKLNRGDTLYGPDMEPLEIDYLYLARADEVMNLELEGDAHTFVGGGIVIGDNWTQNHMEQEEQNRQLSEVLQETERKRRAWEEAYGINKHREV